MPTPRRALVIIDAQHEYVEGPIAIQYPPLTDSLDRLRAALAAADRAGIPVVVVRHKNPAGAAVFAEDSQGSALISGLTADLPSQWQPITKRFASAFAGTELAEWCQANTVDTLTLVGYMANNCLLATAADAAPHGVQAEILADATGTIHLANERGRVSASELHTTLMTLLHSNFAAVADTDDWISAVSAGEPLGRSNLIASALGGKDAFNRKDAQ